MSALTQDSVPALSEMPDGKFGCFGLVRAGVTADSEYREGGNAVRVRTMQQVPIYEFACGDCGERFEELCGAGELPACPRCGGSGATRVLSGVSPPGRLPRGAKVKSSDSRRSEREAARGERIAEARKRRRDGG